MQEQLNFREAAGLEQVWGCTIFLPKGCKMRNGAKMANGAHRAPTSHFSHTACILKTYVHVVLAWVWKWGEQVSGKANWPCLGGSSGGDDQQLSHLNCKVSFLN